MKKNYITILGLMLSMGALGQTNLANQPMPASPKMTTSIYEKLGTSTAVLSQENANRSALRRGNTAIVVGVTKYDLQTNSSVARRVILHADGTVSMVWTTAPDNAFTQRGTGYKYVTTANGNWFNALPLVINRTENSRSGWPNIGVLANGNEFTLGHIAEDGGWVRAENSGKGTAFSVTDANVNDDGLFKPIWGRMANVGNTVYMICSYTDSSAVGEPRAKTVGGISAPMTYSRSLDGGKTWPISHILLPGYDSTRYLNGGGDQYSIDARDSIVAITSTDALEDLAYWKSTNFGLTFTKVIVDSFIYAPYSSKKLMLDTPFTQDGATSIAIDKDGNVHLAWSLSRVFDEDTNDVSYSFYPQTAALAYWSENNPTAKVIATGIDLDLNGDGVLNFAQANISALSGGNLPQGQSHTARNGNTSILTMPSMGFDANGGVFISFSCINESDLDPIFSTNYRDAYILYSGNNGATFGKPLNATSVIGKEIAFPSIAKNVNSFVHMQFQMDELPGTNLQNNAAGVDNHPIGNNSICYLAIPVSQIIAASIDKVAVKVENIADANVFIVSQNQPNPFNGNTEVIIFVTNPTELLVTITNLNGQIVKQSKTQELGMGNHIIEIDASKLQSGVYLYTMQASNGQTVTKKMVVK